MHLRIARLIKNALTLRWLFLLLLASCSSKKSLKGPVCIATTTGFVCANSDIPKLEDRVYKQDAVETDGWVCYPPDTNEIILKRLKSE
jgi:hypothetical protein